MADVSVKLSVPCSVMVCQSTGFCCFLLLKWSMVMKLPVLFFGSVTTKQILKIAFLK